MRCYYETPQGIGMTTVREDYVAQPGEVLFPELATDDELEAAFPGYLAAKVAAAVEADVQNQKINLLSQVDRHQNRAIFLLSKIALGVEVAASKAALQTLLKSVSDLRELLLALGDDL